MTGTEKWAVYNNINCVYDSCGRRCEALVFLHGWTCSSALWSGQSSLFANYRRIAIGLPSQGRSEAPTYIEYSLELFANVINAVLDPKGITRAFPVGHSKGGPVSTMVLRFCPEKFAGIVYVNNFFHLPETYLSHAERKKLAANHAVDTKFQALLNNFWTPKSSDETKTQIVSTIMSTGRHVPCNATTTTMRPHAWRWDEVYHIPALHIVTLQCEKIHGARFITVLYKQPIM